jgi:hypothetical protein
MEVKREVFTVAVSPVNPDRSMKYAIRSQNNGTIYDVYKFFKYISEHFEHFVNINILTKQLT